MKLRTYKEQSSNKNATAYG